MIKLFNLLKEIVSPQRKMIILAGGAGVVKSTLIDKIKGSTPGFEIINPDKYIEDKSSPMFNNLSAASIQVDDVDVPNILSSGKSFIYHTSNKMTSADQISNGSPSKEIDEIGSIASENYDETQKKELETAQQETKDNIQKHRNDQKEYIRKQQTNMADDANNPEIARRAIDRLKGVENPVSTSRSHALW